MLSNPYFNNIGDTMRPFISLLIILATFNTYAEDDLCVMAKQKLVERLETQKVSVDKIRYQISEFQNERKYYEDLLSTVDSALIDQSMMTEREITFYENAKSEFGNKIKGVKFIIKSLETSLKNKEDNLNLNEIEISIACRNI